MEVVSGCGLRNGFALFQKRESLRAKGRKILNHYGPPRSAKWWPHNKPFGWLVVVTGG